MCGCVGFSMCGVCKCFSVGGITSKMTVFLVGEYFLREIFYHGGGGKVQKYQMFSHVIKISVMRPPKTDTGTRLSSTTSTVCFHLFTEVHGAPNISLLCSDRRGAPNRRHVSSLFKEFFFMGSECQRKSKSGLKSTLTT